jgi:hypothetical protein
MLSTIFIYSAEIPHPAHIYLAVNTTFKFLPAQQKKRRKIPAEINGGKYCRKYRRKLTAENTAENTGGKYCI